MNVLEGMRDIVEQRAERFCPLPMAKFFPLSDLKSLTWLGTFSWANQEAKTRWLKKDVAISLFGIPQIPPEVARDYLRAKYTKRRRHTVNQFKAINEHRSAPLYSRVGQYREMAYVDIVAAYWSIISIVGWDVDYHPSRWIGKRSEMDDFPIPDNKIARNSLVSAGLVTRQNIWTGEKVRSINAHSTLINYDVWAICQDILHCLAQFALKQGAVHIHTDGYILPEKSALALIEEARVWGLVATVKATGDCQVKGIGSYTIGEKRTKHDYHFACRDINKLYRPDIEFLRPRIAKFARTRINWTLPVEGPVRA